MPFVGSLAEAFACASAQSATRKGQEVELNGKVFSRERLAGYDPELMSRSTVLIVGAGALGQNTALNLAVATRPRPRPPASFRRCRTQPPC